MSCHGGKWPWYIYYINVRSLVRAGANILGYVTPGSLYSFVDKLWVSGSNDLYLKLMFLGLSLKGNRSTDFLRHPKNVTSLVKEDSSVFNLNPSFEPESNILMKII